MADNDVMEMIMTIIQIPCNIAFPSHHNPKFFFLRLLLVPPRSKRHKMPFFQWDWLLQHNNFQLHCLRKAIRSVNLFLFHIYIRAHEEIYRHFPPPFFFLWKGAENYFIGFSYALFSPKIFKLCPSRPFRRLRISILFSI